MELDLIFVKWVDTIADPEAGWKDAESTDEFFERDDNIVHELGFLWDENDDYLFLISSWMPGDVPITRNRTKIPKRWILSRDVITLTNTSNEGEDS